MSIELSEQEQLRRQSLAALRELGIDPYPAARYEVTATAREIADNYDEARGNYQDIRIAGRIMSRRIMGSASFFELQDHTGRIQVYIRRDDVCPEGDPTLYNTVFKKLLDIGDFIGVEGFAFHTNTGELSVHCRKFTVLSKSIRPLPVVKAKDGQTFDAFTDPEGARRIRPARQDRRHDAPVLQRARLRRGGDPDPAADSGRRLGTPVHHAPQCARHRPVPAHRQ